MKNWFPAIIIIIATACSKAESERFEINGTLRGVTTDTTLVLEAVTLEGDIKIDSARVKADGMFTLHGARPQNPEFYRLRVGNELLNICIDSTETLFIDAILGRMATEYSIDGSEKCERLRQMAILQQALRHDINHIATRDGMSPNQRQEAIEARLVEYKQILIRDFIAPDPASAVAYSALFQTFGGKLVFNPVSDRQDVKWMAAVATAWDMLYPGTQRTENLHNVALRGLANTSAHRTGLNIDISKVTEAGIIDITLPDVDGMYHSLSDLKGKVVLLDFTAYSMPDNNRRTLWLRDLYTRYHKQGLEIYQIGLDADRHFWATRADALPWVCVYEAVDADILKLYQVRQLPSLFLIDRSNTLHARGENIRDVEAEIKTLL